MAYSVAQRVISKKDSIYDYCDDLSRKSKLLYNASLFRIRNVSVFANITILKSFLCSALEDISHITVSGQNVLES